MVEAVRVVEVEIDGGVVDDGLTADG